MDIDQDLADYQQIQRWLKGKKPPPQGRTWHRMAQAITPPRVRAPLQQACGEPLGDIVGIGIAVVLYPVMALAPLAIGYTCVVYAPSLVETMIGPHISTDSPVHAMAQATNNVIKTLAPLAGGLLGLATVFRAFRFLLTRD